MYGRMNLCAGQTVVDHIVIGRCESVGRHLQYFLGEPGECSFIIGHLGLSLLEVFAEAALATSVGLHLIRMAGKAHLLSKDASRLFEDLVDVVPSIASLPNALVTYGVLFAILALNALSIIGMDSETKNEPFSSTLGATWKADQFWFLGYAIPKSMLSLNDGLAKSVNQLFVKIIIRNSANINLTIVLFDSRDQLFSAQQKARYYV